MLNKLAKFLPWKPLFFLVKGRWVERNEPLMVIDIGDDLKYLLRRPGNEKAEYVLIGFRAQTRKAIQLNEEEK